MKNRLGIIWLTVVAGLALVSIAAYDPIMSRTVLNAYSSADQALTSQGALQNSTNLLVTLSANKAYHVRAVLHFAEAGILGGYKFGFTGPGSPSIVRLYGRVDNGVTDVIANLATATALGTVVNGALASVGDHVSIVEGVVVCGASGGVLQLQFCQNTSDGSAITLYKGSSLIATPLN